MFVLSNKIHPTKVLRKFSFWDNLIFSYSEMTFCFKYAVGDSDGKKSNSSRLISICYHISSSTIAKMLQFQSITYALYVFLNIYVIIQGLLLVACGFVTAMVLFFFRYASIPFIDQRIVLDFA